MTDPAASPDDLAARAQEADTVDDERVPDRDPDTEQESIETVTNDAVAGETVEPQRGDGTDDGPTGGAPREGEPDEWEHDENESDGGAVDLGTDVNSPL